MSDKRKKSPLGMLAVIGLLVGALALFAYREKDQERRQAATDAAIRAALDAPKIKATADELGAAYEANPVDFELAAKGNSGVLVSGTVNQIGMELGGSNPYITLGAGLVGAVRCEFDAGRMNEVAALRKGQKVTVKGILKGGAVGTVNLDHCEIAQ